MPVKEAAAALNSFVEIGFLTREELNENVKKLFAKARPAPSTATPSPAAPTTAIQNTNTQQAIDAQSTTTQSTAAQTTTTQTTTTQIATTQIATSQIQSPSQSAGMEGRKGPERCGWRGSEEPFLIFIYICFLQRQICGVGRSQLWKQRSIILDLNSPV